MAEKYYIRNADIVAKEVDDAVFLVGADNASLYHLNELGTVLWKLLADTISIAEASAIIHDAFPSVPVKKINNDIAALICDLEANGLVACTTLIVPIRRLPKASG